ncbi:MAG: hypothetical protein AUK44_03715 [Porphyromonadaceae bacterium CG2_30_38_12]|nr:MAG: hypothetical protein AUK44_03715 [Porphyromonadaceae bacterium CG2_30_38_12]
MKLFKFATLFFMFFVTKSFGATYYVDAANGGDTRSGLSVALAVKSLFKAAEKTVAGDTVFVMNGTYTNTNGNPLITETSSGTATDWIVWTNYPGHTPVLNFIGWQGIYIKGNYIEINGLTIRGQSANITLTQALAQGGSCANPSGSLEGKYNGNGIYVDGRTNTRVHHINVKNCTIYECGGGGIQTIQTDFITIENNVIYNNAWYSIYAPSGISMYQNWNSDGSTDTNLIKNIIRNNKLYGNRMYVPWPSHSCQFTDGNGIIIDDTKNTQNGSTLGAYKGRTLIYNNIVYNNGGSGIHTFQSEHVDIINNTAFENSQTPEIDNGEIFPQNSADVRIFNNILVAPAGQKINTNMSNGTGIVYNYNLHFGGGTAALTGANTKTGNPLFKDLAAFDFQLSTSSPAINAGISTLSGSAAPTTDFAGLVRPNDVAHDMGAYEFQVSTGINDLKSSKNNSIFNLYPNPAIDNATLNISAISGDKLTVSLMNLNGQEIYSKSINGIDGENKFVLNLNYQKGLYLVKVSKGLVTQTELLAIK